MPLSALARLDSSVKDVSASKTCAKVSDVRMEDHALILERIQNVHVLMVSLERGKHSSNILLILYF